MVTAPPPLPRARISGFLLASLFSTIIAVAITAALCTTEDLISTPWQRLGLAIVGNGAATLALIFGAVALFDRRKGWPIAIFVGVVSIGVFSFLVPQLPQSLHGLAGQVQRATLDGMSQAKESLAQRKGAITSSQVRPLLVAWGEEAMVRPYEEHGHHDAKWDDVARQFIRGMALELSGAYPHPGLERLRPPITDLRRSGCDDPWVLFLIHRRSSADPDFGDAMHKAVKDLEDAGYSGFPVWLARAEAVRADRVDGTAPKGTLDPACLKSLRDALTAKSLEQGALEAWLTVFDEEPGASVLKQDGEGVCRMIEAMPNVPAWFPSAIRGRLEIDLAWEARGSGWANTVSSEQWRQFGEHLQLAREALERACQLAPNEPEPARALITVELGSTGINQMRQRFDAVLASRFDYTPAYEAFRYGLRPRWHGSEEAVLQFGRNCLATQRFDTAVPWQMLRAVQDAAGDREDSRSFYSREAPWKDLDAMFAGYLAHGNPDRKQYYLSAKLILASRAGRDSAVASLLKELNYEIDPQASADWNLSLNWVGRMAALSGPANDLVLAAERLEAHDPEQALQKLLAAQKISGQPPVSIQYVANRITEVEAIVALKKASWQSLMPSKDLAGWKTESGNWQLVTPTTMQLETEDSGAMLTRLEPVGDEWELRGELALATEKPGRVEFAIFCGPPDDQKQRGFCLRFWRRSNLSSGISLARGFGEDAVSKSAYFKQKLPFFIRLENQRLRVRVDDGQWYAGQPLPEGVVIDKGSILSIGSTGGGKQKLEILNLEWRAPQRAVP